jgi:hypothetical protein
MYTIQYSRSRFWKMLFGPSRKASRSAMSQGMARQFELFFDNVAVKFAGSPEGSTVHEDAILCSARKTGGTTPGKATPLDLKGFLGSSECLLDSTRLRLSV